MSSSTFRVAFEGVPFVDGEIAVSDLAPALLALGDVVQAANRALNGDRAEARLKLRATQVGSFEALLSIDVSMIDAIKDLLDSAIHSEDRLVAANQLMDLLLKGGAIGGGVFAAIKFLRGKRPEKVQDLGDGTTSITLNHTQIIVDGRTIVLLEDIKTREAVAAFGEKALGINGVESLSIGEKGADAKVVLTPEDRSAFRMPAISDDVTHVETAEREVLLKIVTSHFRDGYK